MADHLLKQLEKFISIDEKYLKIFLSKFKPESLSKDQYFIREGQISRKIGFILNGSMICAYAKKGEEIIEEFSFEQEFITDYFSFLTNLPSEKNVKCLEDTQLLVLYYDDLQTLYAQNPIFERAGRFMAEALFINWQQKAKSLMLDDAEKRYKDLLAQKPYLTQRVPQYLIASYLNVKPETLSRIRKKLATN